MPADGPPRKRELGRGDPDSHMLVKRGTEAIDERGEGERKRENRLEVLGSQAAARPRRCRS